MINIQLIHNKGYHWINNGATYVKGYINREGRFTNQHALLDYFSHIQGMETMEKKMQEANGLFSVVVRTAKSTFIAVDRIRSFPLFYTWISNRWIITDDIDTLVKAHPNQFDFKNASVSEFLTTGYVTGNDTLVDQIYQVRAGELIELTSHSVIKRTYFTYLTIGIWDKPYAALKKDLELCIHQVFNRLTHNLQGKTAVIPLSGGYDSRLVTAMLVKMRYPEVICFTYGRKGIAEKNTAQKVASQLQLNWHFIEYNPDLIEGYIHDPLFDHYFKYSANYTSMFFMQEYFAVQYLKEHSLIPKDAVFIPGHSADFLAGSHLRNFSVNSKPCIISSKIYHKYYNLLHAKKRSRQALIQKIDHLISSTGGDTQAIPHSIFENWILKERQSKFIVNSCNLYNFMGYAHLLPFWDHAFIDFFKRLPFRYKIFKKLYNDLIINAIFKELQLDFKEESEVSKNKLRIQNLKDHIKYRLPEAFIHRLIKPDKDPVFYREITRYMVKEAPGISFIQKVKEKNALIVQWYIHKLFSESIWASQHDIHHYLKDFYK